MIRFLSRVSAPPMRTRDVFVDVDSWPRWMPGLERMEVQERHEGRLVVHAVQRQMGRNWPQVQEITMTREGLRQRQIEGSMRRWDADWRFLPHPDGRGTTISLSLDLDLGFLGLMIPNRALQRFLENLFEQIVRQVEVRAAASEVVKTDESEAFLRVVKTLRGLEVEIAGDRYLLRAAR